MLTVLSVLLGVLAGAFTLAPVWRRPAARAEGVPPAQPSAPIRELLDRREAALAGLAEIEFDRTLGNLGADDYAHLRAQYRAQAVGVVQALEIATGAPLALETPIASAVAAPRAGPRPARRIAAVAVGTGVLLAGGVVWLAGPAAPAAPGPPLPVQHVHAALLVPGSHVALIAHHTGLLRSTDDGHSWQPVAGVPGEVAALAAAPAAGSDLFLAGPDQVRRSQDAGQTWEPLPLPAPGAVVGALAVGAGAPPPLYAAVAGSGIWRWTAGRAWQLTGGGLPADVTSLVLRSGNLAALYAASPSAGVLASGDEGQTWGSASGQVNGVLPTGAVYTLAVDPDSGDAFTGADGLSLRGAQYAGTDQGLFKSIDGGTSWTPLPLPGVLVAVSARAQPAPLLLAVDSRSRVWRSNDRGTRWAAP